ncbi:hypothetical protein FLAN108750_13410 [Flavobacterium antarcticum]|uniref:hypothetical protein n=1 Tax=Flavobacterium antarcticum TaxID=271155 RepID=UPI0003B63282|nr:hypothetical protein [Flavobacterium antarcticum]
MDKGIRTKLIELARLRTTWTYSQLNEQLLLNLNFNDASDRALIGEWLGDISIHEHEKGRPLLSSLITHKDKLREQGDGFYKLCEDLLGIPWQELKADKEWENNQIAKCFEFWTNPTNYKKYKND